MWHSKKKPRVLQELKTTLDGLSKHEVSERLAKHGPNLLKKQKTKGPVRIFFEQFTNFLVILLIVSAIISYVIGETLDATAILIIVIINGIFGFFQEYKAEKAIEALRSMATPSCKVIREGEERIISSEQLVPGDVIIVEKGDRVPADSYIFESMSLQADESMLTGESIPVKKKTQVLPEKTPVAERNNMIFSGTIITNGRAKAIVVSTGMNTQFGKIAEMVQVSDEETPLQKRMARVGKILGTLSLVVCFMVFVVGVLEGTEIVETFKLAVSLAVSAVPEGLPATITLALTLGVQRLVKKNALIRKLSSVETLGTVNYICTDKTGTITKNQMTVKKVFLNNQFLEVTGTGYSPSGEFLKKGEIIDPSKNKQLEVMIRISRLCNDSHLVKHDRWKVIGDPTEGALLVMAAKAGMMKVDKYYPRQKELFFDSERKRMSTLNKGPKGKEWVFVKGAPESILEASNRIMIDGKVKKLTSKQKKKMLEKNEKMASQALRVLAFAYKKHDKKEMEKDLIFVGMVGMIDPPREEVKQAIELCNRAGIKVMMITGDHKITAVSIAKEVGLYKKGSHVLTESQIQDMSDEELEYKIEKTTVCARISPKSKSRIVNALKSKGHIVSVTGDGVNDAPALKRADIGISVGSGTDVTKQASDMILVDDNFATIVKAVEEGRGIFDNIKKFLKLLLSTNFDEIFLVTTAFLLKLPSPFVPLQLLWLNILSDGLPALSLGADPKDPHIMYSKPRDPKENVLNKILGYSIFVGIISYIVTGIIFFVFIPFADINYVRTMVFTTTVIFEMFLVFSVRTEKTFWRAPPNYYLILAVIISISLQLLAIYNPFLQTILETVPLSMQDWLFIISICASGFFFVELSKFAHQKLIKSHS